MNERRWIEVRIDRLEELVDERDPTPSPGKDLNPYVSEYILSWARETTPDDQVGIRFHVSEEVSTAGIAEAQMAIRDAFVCEAGLEERRLHALFREGRVSLAIGLVALTLSLVVSDLIAAEQGVMAILKQSLVVAGWVAMWKPVQLYLYDWWPIRREIRMYRRLAGATVEIVTGG